MNLCVSGLVSSWLLGLMIVGGAQQKPDDSHVQPTLLKVLTAEYPSLAKAARVSGDVHLQLLVRKDGTVESADVVDGPAMLRPASLDDARSAIFDCTICTEKSTPYELTMRFQMTSTDPPKSCEDLVPHGFHVAVDSGEHVITISTPEIWTCDPAVETSTTLHRIRAARCIYLWKCAWRGEK